MGMEPIRETQSIEMFRDNKIATPARVTSFSPSALIKTPSIRKDYLRDIGVGKKVGERFPQTDTYVPADYQVS